MFKNETAGNIWSITLGIQKTLVFFVSEIYLTLNPPEKAKPWSFAILILS